MLDVVLLILKIGTLLLLFLFIYWVVRSARRDLVAGSPALAQHPSPSGSTAGQPPRPLGFGGFPDERRSYDAGQAAGAGRASGAGAALDGQAPGGRVPGGEAPEASWARAGAAPARAGLPAAPAGAASAAWGEPARGADPAAAAAPAALVVVRSTSLVPGARIEVGDQVTMGRAPENDVVLDDPFVSSAHARVVRRGAELYVEDLGSTNGTFLNERAVTQGRLGGEMRLRVGETVFRLE